MADDKKEKSSGGDGGSDTMFFIGFFVVLYILWLISGGPDRDILSKNDKFITPDGQTYNEPISGQPGSVTNTLPFLK
jgi:hypothetical protein